MTVPKPGSRVVCERCKRPPRVCYCAHVTQVPTRTRVLVLQHPREAEKAIGTARIAALCLPSAQIAVGVEFKDDARVQALVNDPARPAVLLYPSEHAQDLRVALPRGPITLVVLDGTWAQAKKLKSRNRWLAALPQVCFLPDQPSEYRIRREPREDYVSTIEALALTLGALEGAPERFNVLLAPFRAMVDLQLGFAARSTGSRKRLRRRDGATTPARLPALLTAPQLVCAMGEGNAWPRDPSLGGRSHAHELLQWSALRMSDGARFEALLAPRLPLSPTATKHARIAESAVRAGLSVPGFSQAWGEFLKPDDVLCTWGPYAANLVRQENAPLPSRIIDIRKVAGDYLRRGPGSSALLVRELGLSPASLGHDRCGERLGLLVALTQWLGALARGDIPRDDHRTPGGGAATT